MAVQIQMRRDTASNWTTNDPTLAAGEWGLETDTSKFKIGNGSTAWSSLAYSSLPSNVLPLTGGAMTGAITTNSTFDGVDVAARDAVLTSTTTTANAALPKAGGTLTGAIVAADQIISAPVMKDYSESTQAMAAHDVDLTLGNVQTYTLSGNQTLTFSNAPASGKAGSFTLIVTNGGSATLTWPTSVDWAGGTAPTLTSSGKDILTFTTIDGGTIWYGFAAGLDMK